MEKLFSIGEVSKIKGITIKALRYYHKEGILVPIHVDKSSGYRYYSLNQFIHIDIIKGARELGTSIEEIKELFKEDNTYEILKFLELKRCEAQENIKKMEKIIKGIDDVSSYLEYSKDASSSSEIKCEILKKRYVVALPCKGRGDLKELIYYSELDKYIEDNDLETTMERGTMHKVTMDENMDSQYVFSVLKEATDIELNENIKILPKGKYLTLTYSKKNENERMEKLLDYIKNNNIKVKNHIELDLLDDLLDIENYSCQIQMLIEEC